VEPLVRPDFRHVPARMRKVGSPARGIPVCTTRVTCGAADSRVERDDRRGVQLAQRSGDMSPGAVLALSTTMRLALLLALTSCTIAGTSRPFVSARAPTLSSEALDHQDPSADTSHNAILRVDRGVPPRGPLQNEWQGGGCDALAAIGYALIVGALR
jgi:hypothetical protein